METLLALGAGAAALTAISVAGRMPHLFLATIPDSVIPGAVGTVFTVLCTALAKVYADSKASMRYAREERKELALQLEKNTDALRELGRNCSVRRS